MTTQITRFDLQQLAGMTPKLLRFFEDLFVSTAQNSAATGDLSQATQSIQNATVITLSPNNAFNNERVLVVGAGLEVSDSGPNGTLTLTLANNLTFNGGFAVTFNLEADTNLDLPSSGRVMVKQDFASLTNALNDAAAAAAGVPVGGLYRNGSVVMVRVA